ncbi:MAG: MarR family winged helix-turn-helix transcriptional regulator [Candidatus Fimenecus sp.]
MQKNVSKKMHDLEWCRHYVTRRALKDSGVYFGQPPILDYLAKNGTGTQNEIAKALHVSPASVSVSLRRMQKAGLIEKAADETDLRCNRMSLTEKGNEQHEYIHGCFEEIDRRLYADFSAAELETLEQMLTRLCDNLMTMLPAGKKLEEIMEEEMQFGGGCRHGKTD